MAEPTPTDVLLERTLRRAAQLRRRRRAALGSLGAAVVALAVVIPVATLGPSHTGPQVQVGAPATKTAPSTGVAPPAPASPCTPSELLASVDHRDDGALVAVTSGTYDDGTTLAVTNRGPAACTLSGAPAVGLGAGDHGASPLGVPAGGGAATVTLLPGQSAGSILRWQAGHGTCVVAPATLDVLVPGASGALTATWQAGAICGDPLPNASPFSAVTTPVGSTSAPLASGLCSTGQLQFVYLPGGSDTTSNPADFSFEVVNVSADACDTGDYPGSSVSDTSGAPILVSSGRSDIGGAPTRLTLPPGGVASFVVTLPNVAGQSCYEIGSFHFIAPNDHMLSPAVAVSGGASPPQTCGSGTSSVGPLHLGLTYPLDHAAG